MELKINRRTRAAGKDGLEMFHRLQQRIGMPADRGRLLATKPRPQRIQLATQSAPQAIHRFQRNRQPQFFGRGLERKSSQQFHQPLPHQ